MVDKTKGLHPDLVIKITKVLEDMKAEGFEMMITDGVRSTEKQKKLYAQGRTSPGSIVTYADGVIKKSNHQIKEDGYGHAVDCAFIVKGKPSWDIRLPWRTYGELAKSQGLIWGGDWKKLHDLPHVELP